ncbi:MAG: hypothetical protein ACPGRX_08460, partial [Bdellovibrionales bacterium]
MFKTKKHITIGIAAVLASAALWLALSYTLAPGYIANAAEPWLIPDIETLPDLTPKFRVEPEGYQPFMRDAETL